MIDLESGQRVSRYELRDKIGQGGMGVVFRALDTRLGREVALKFVPPHLADAETRVRFYREARSAAALDHPNICPVFEIDEVEKHLFIAMAFVDGEPLDRIIARGPLEIDRALDLAIQIGDGLGAAHEKEIVHRDVKAANVIVTPSGRAKILDFGVSRQRDASPLTQTGVYIGTTAYMSPEQLAGDHYDHRADIWALGVLLYEMLTGSLPFEGPSPIAMMHAVLHTAPRPIGALRQIQEINVEHVLNRVLAKQPKRRYQRMSDFTADLRELREAMDRETAHLAINSPGRHMPARHTAARTTAARVQDADGPVQVLVVDDEPDLELLVRQHFRKQTRAGELGFYFAEGGQQALQVLADRPEVGIVLTDIRMPGMDGLTLLGHLGELDRTLKAVVVSAYGDLGNIRTAMNRGAFDFITKPIDFSDLETTIAKAWSELSVLRDGVEARHRLSAVQQELSVARRIRETVPAGSRAPGEGVEIQAYRHPAPDVGGDFHHFYPLEAGRVAFLIGEVAGTGVAAAMVSVIARTLIIGVCEDDLEPSHCLDRVGRLLASDNLNTMSVSALFGHLDLRSGEIVYANAGHHRPYLLRPGLDPDLVDAEPGPALGEGDEHRYRTERLTLEPGGILLLFTDGVPSATDRMFTPFSVERLEATLRESSKSSAAGVIRDLVRDLEEFVEDVPQAGDMTALAIGRPAEGS